MASINSAPHAPGVSLNAQPVKQRHQEEALLIDDDCDDVFSNPDTAELESRSDATGATSPTPHSPGPSSPSNRLPSHIAIASNNDPYATVRMSDMSHKPMTLNKMPPPPTMADLEKQFGQQSFDRTPRSAEHPVYSTTSAKASSRRPNFGRAQSASGATMQTLSTPQAALSSKRHSPRLGGHSNSLSASHVSFQQLPSAHGLPSDPREASTVSKLFAHRPAQSPAEEYTGFHLPVDNRLSSVNMMASPSAQSISTSPVHVLPGGRLSRPVTRPSSPVRRHGKQSSGPIGLGFSPRTSYMNTEEIENESSIFERDIEHRNAAHVLSKQEALDVAIPSVLDDAMEAITNDEARVEIVTPHTAPPMALSSQALNAHSHSQSRLQSTKASSASSPAHSPSPPLSHTGAANEPPPGSMAAQIAERFGAKPQTIASQDDGLIALRSAARSPHRHRRPKSDASVSSSSSLKSKSHHAPLGVEQVLAASSPRRSASSSPTAATKPSPRTRTGLPPSTPISTAASSTSGLPTATALPTLPLPNPYRLHTPTPHPDGATLMQPSLSIDGAVMPSSESATLDASLDGLADAVASAAPTTSSSVTNSPSTRFAFLGHELNEEGASPYTSRSPKLSSATIQAPASPTLERFSRASGMTPKTDDSSSFSTVHAGSRKRLSFFSYADIINQTPGEVVDLDSAIRHAEAPSSTPMARGASADFK